MPTTPKPSRPSDDTHPEVLPAAVPQGPAIEQPAKLIRIAAMIREMLADVRQSKPDEAGRRRVREVYERALTGLKEGVSKELQDELDTLTLPLDSTSSESEIRLAQAQLVGWLEGLFQGIQAALWSQHMQARAEIEEMRRRRGLPPAREDPPGSPVSTCNFGDYAVTLSSSRIMASSLGVTFTPWVGNCRRWRTPSVFASGSVRKATS